MARDDNNKNDGGSGGITYDSPYYLHPSDYPKQLHENKTSHESAAFKAFQRHNGPPGLNKERNRAKSIEEGNKNCTECNEDGHTREGCFKDRSHSRIDIRGLPTLPDTLFWNRFDEVFSTWMAFGGNIRDLGSFGEEMDKITDLHQIYEEVLFTERGDGIVGIKRRRRDLSSDGVRDLATASGRGRFLLVLKLVFQLRSSLSSLVLEPL
ncbi:hypothetical protein Tco_0919338 [Tanacetum coccineum]